jgi:hypothetical protein
LTQPYTLSGTAVLTVESVGAADVSIWLHLRASKRALKIESSRTTDYVLGTDFTYEDLRFWLPTDEFDVQSASHAEGIIGKECIITARRRDRGSQFSTIRLHFDLATSVPLTIEWLNAETQASVRTLSARNIIRTRRIHTPTLISISRPLERYESVMTLRRLTFEVRFARDIFEPAFLLNIPYDYFGLLSRCSHEIPLADDSHRVVAAGLPF